MPYDFDIAIIGAGVVGLAVASEIAKSGRDVCILEKNESFGRETSSRNSGVIHTGILSPAGSLNASLGIESNKLLYEIGEKFAIPCRQTGKLLVAVDESQIEVLEGLYLRREEGIEMKMLSRKELHDMEPYSGGVAAILLPEAGVIDAYGLMGYFFAKAQGRGAQMVCKANVTAIEKMHDSYKIRIEEPDGISEISARVVINCAGHNSDRVSAMAGINAYKLYYFKGEYYTLSRAKGKLVERSLIYPILKTGGFVGIHTVLDIDGRVRPGPDFFDVEKVNYAIDDSRKKMFFDAASQLFPFIEWDDIEPESAGVMPRLYAKNEKFKEFVIRHESDKGFPGFVNVVGIESPGLTASPAIGRYVKQIIEDIVR